MLENSTYSVISPKVQRHYYGRDSNLAKIAAETMKITAHDIKQLGIIDDVISEPLGGAHKDIEQQALAIKSAFVEQLDSLESLSPMKLLMIGLKNSEILVLI